MKTRLTLDEVICKSLKAKKVLNIIAIVGVFYILLYQINALRKLCKAICQYLIDWYGNIELVTIRQIYFYVEILFKAGIVLAFITSIFLWIVRIKNDIALKKKKGDGRFEQSMFRYLQESTIPRCFLVTGQWGSGKTYEVNTFFDKYYKLTNTKVYRISCFGLSSRKELIDEINIKIEQDDNSVYSLMIKVLQYVPVIGGAIYKFLKKTYKYGSIKKGSIFVFDDFERITSRVITGKYTTQIYKQSHSFLRSVTQGRDRLSEFIEIKDEFKTMGKAVNDIGTFIEKNYSRVDYDKYIAITGLINELIETYGMKVIILCNSDILGDKFVNDVLISKLNCWEYKKIITTDIKVSFIESILMSKIIQDKEREKCISEYLNLVKCKLEEIVLNNTIKNLRLFGALIEAFIDTAILVDAKKLNIDFLNSLMNSMLVIHTGYYLNSLDKIELYTTGANIEFLIKLYGGPIDASSLIRINNNAEEIKWIDPLIAGYWILNLSKPQNIDNICIEWKEYKFAELEKQMVIDGDALCSANDCNITHILFYQTELPMPEVDKWDSEKYIMQALQDIDFGDIQNVQSVLDLTYKVFNGRVHRRFEQSLFSVLKNGGAKDTLDESNYIRKDYADYLKSFMN